MKTTRAARRRGLTVVAVLAATALLSACAPGAATETQGGNGTGKISVWSLGGTDAEVAALKSSISNFNSSQKEVEASLRLLPGDNYTTTILNTPTDQLPDVLQIDGPTLASFAYNGKIAPISEYVSKETVDNATAGSIAEGTFNDKLYGLAQFDSAMGFYGNKAMFDEAGVSYPKALGDSWTSAQFKEALAKLAAANPAGKSLNIDEGALSGEWGTYGFSPLIQSAGGNLIANGKAAGTLDSPESVKALSDFASWKQYSDPNADGNAFPDGRVAVSLSGHWNYATYSKKLGDNLIALPLPDMGDGPKAGAGSLTWGLGGNTKNGAAAGKFLDYLLNDESVTAMTAANGAPPATKSAFKAASLYQKGGALSLWGDQLAHACAADHISSDCVAVYRPVTAGYPAISSNFSSALAAIWGGADPKAQLSKAAQSIDSNFKDNDGYK